MSDPAEPLFLAASVEEAAEVEKLLKGEGIEYDLRPEATLRRGDGAACYQGLLIEVSPSDAARARRLLAGSGFVAGIVDPR